MADYDLVLLHAPSVYDFRERDDILFAYLGNSDSVHVSAIFEMPPVGMLAIRSRLRRQGYRCEFFNLAARMLKDRAFDVESFLARLHSPLFGLDLHWLVHAQGSLAIAERLKQLHPEAGVLFGGITATYYQEQLIAYPQVDYVVRGFDTLDSVSALLRARLEQSALNQIPNVTWKDQSGNININPLAVSDRTYDVAVNWAEVFNEDDGKTPYHLIIPQAGCEYNCRWCGGSNYSFRRQLKVRTPVRKSPELLTAELRSLPPRHQVNHTVTMIDFWHEDESLLKAGLRGLQEAGIGSVHYSLHQLPPVSRARQLCEGLRATFELSPDSHDLHIAQAGGRGCYTMEQMEAFIDALLPQAYSFEVYFMIGLPYQTTASVMQTVEYCDHLLEKYLGRRVIPFICPLLPFLDPGSIIYEHPEKWGYTLFCHTLEDHRQALLRPSWKQRLNYETRWMSKDDLVRVSYAAVRRLTEIKIERGLFPECFGRELLHLIDETTTLLDRLECVEKMPAGPLRESSASELRSQIKTYNDRHLYHTRSQQRPVDLGFAAEQWFDTNAAIEAVLQAV
jgi:clorobiocin/coumermycin A biosynthesis protein CloN6/CouN6